MDTIKPEYSLYQGSYKQDHQSSTHYEDLTPRSSAESAALDLPKKSTFRRHIMMRDSNSTHRKHLNPAEEAHEYRIHLKSNIFKRGQKTEIKSIQDKKTRSLMKRIESKISESIDHAARAEMLLPSQPGFLEVENELESTWKVKQRDIQQQSSLTTHRRFFNLHLEEYAPYIISFSRNGKFLLIGGSKGHVVLIQWLKNDLLCELKLGERIHAVKFLHNETMFAVAQTHHVYIYDQDGVELHCLRKHAFPLRLEFLPYHFLLCSVGKQGVLCYQDTSTGQVVSTLRTKLGPCMTLCQNPHNAILHLGHQNGMVTLWAPSSYEVLVKIICHRGPVIDIAIDSMGRWMVTAGADGLVHVWKLYAPNSNSSSSVASSTFHDIPQYGKVRTFQLRHLISHLSISQTGLLAMSYSNHVEIYKDYWDEMTKTLYMRYALPCGGSIHSMEFCPYEDVLALGHDYGVTTIVAPGSGEANFDTYEANPFETVCQRREATVHRLLEKIQPDMILLDSNAIGGFSSLIPEVHEKLTKDSITFGNTKKWLTSRYQPNEENMTEDLEDEDNEVHGSDEDAPKARSRTTVASNIASEGSSVGEEINSNSNGSKRSHRQTSVKPGYIAIQKHTKLRDANIDHLVETQKEREEAKGRKEQEILDNLIDPKPALERFTKKIKR